MKWRFAIIPLLVSTISSFGQGSPTDPTITSQPQSQTVPAGADVTLSVTASGTAPLTYQWWDSAGAILDATNADYILNPAQTNNTDNYFVIVGNDYGAITSAVAALVVYLPVSITSQPQNQTACAGSEVTWTVAASGTNLTYQWQRDGTNLVEGADNFTGTTSATLTNSAVGAEDNVGTTNGYACVVSLGGYSAMSTVVSLTVNPLPGITTDTTNQTACAGSEVTWTVAASGTNLTYQWQRDGTNLVEGVGNFTGTTSASLTNSSISLADAQDSNAVPQGYACVVTANGSCPVTSTVASLTVNALPGVSVNSATVCAGGSATLTATTGAGNPSYVWSDNETTASITVTPATTTTYTVTVTDGTTGCANGGSGTVTVNPLPGITTDTTNQTACAGSEVTWTVAASGTNLTYQWQRDGTNLVEGVGNFTGTTSASLTNSSISLADAQDSNAVPQGYACVVTANGSCPVTSTVASLTVNALPGVSVNSATVCAGGSATLTATTGAGNPSYVWSDNETTASITVTPATTTTYTVTVTDGTTGCANGGSGTVTVNPLPGITTDTTNQTACAGSEVTWTVAASGTNLTYQWQRDGTNLVEGVGNFTGTTSASLTNSSISLADAQDSNAVPQGYACVVTANGSCPVTSTVASLTVNALPGVSVNSATVCAGGSATLTATTGAGNPSYVWSDNETTASITVTPATTTTYTVTVTDGTTGCANGGSGTVTVNPLPGITTDTTNQTACAGSEVTWTVAASGTNLTYQWQRDGTNLVEGVGNFTGTTSASLTNSSISLADAQDSNAVPQGYACVVTANGSCPVTSTVASLTVNALPGVSVNSATVCAGGSATLTATTGAGNPSYVWSDNETTASITVTPATTTTYTVTVTDGTTGCANGGSGTVTVNPLPGITTDTTNQTACAGSEVTWTVAASGTNLTYQWQRDGTNLVEGVGNFTGTTSASLTNSSISLADAQDSNAVPQGYACVVTANGSCPVTSTVASLTVNALPGVSVNSATVCAGGSATLTATTGAGNPSYVWSDNETTASITVTPATTTTYTVTVTDGTTGCANGGSGTVTVNPLPGITTDTTNQTACAGSEVTWTVAASGTNLTYQWQRDGTNLVEGVGNFTGTTSASLTNSSISLADAQDSNAVPQGYACVVTANGSCPVTSTVASLTVNALPGVSVNSATVCAGGSATLTATTGAGNPSYVWSDNETTASITVTPATTTTYTVTVTDGTTGCANGGSGTVTVNPLPGITTDTTNQTACAGSEVTWTVAASGTNLTYQWQRDGTNLVEGVGNFTGTTSASLTNSSISLADAQDSNAVPQGYACVVTANGSCPVTSTVASLTVNALPGVSVNSATVCAGGSATLTATTGAGNPSYVWSDNETTASITVTPATTTTYTVTVTDGTTGCANGGSGTVTVNPLPGITTDTTNQTACAGSEVTWTVAASGTNLTYQWQRDGTNLVEGVGNFTGTTSASLTNSSISLADAQDSNAVPQGYACVVTANGSCPVTSTVASLTVNALPVLTTDTTNQTAYAGSEVTWTVAASGTNLTYQWQRDGTNLVEGADNFTGTTSATLTNSAVGAEDNVGTTNGYACVVSLGGCSAMSTVVSLVVYSALNITGQPQSQAVPAGGNATLSVTASGIGPLSYQWQFNGTNLPNDIITTVAGNGTTGYSGDDGAATNASLNGPYGVAVDAAGNLFVADDYNQRIRKVDTNGIITTVAGNGIYGYSGDGGAATDASLFFPADVTVDTSGNLFIADQDNHRVRKVDTNGIITTVAGNGTIGYSGDGGAATSASLTFPRGVSLDAAGNLFIVDSGSSVIRKVDTNGIITTVAGNGTTGYSGDDGAATNASLNQPDSVAVDAFGNLFIADQYNSLIRQVDTNGLITTVAGNGTAAYSGDGRAATDASLNGPSGVAVDAFGNLFIADQYNSLIRQVDTNGIITTVAGNSRTNQYGYIGGYSGDGGAATNASLYYPYCVVVRASGNLFISDQDNNRIREVALTTGPAVTIYNLNTNNAGNYTVIVSNPFGSITSSVATVTLALSPSISVQPVGQGVAAGTSATLSVTASGAAPLSYQWWDSAGAILAATNASYMLNPAQTNNSDNYFVVVTNAYGSVTSSVAALVVYLPVTITSQPASQVVPALSTAMFAVTASSYPAPFYQWTFNNTNLPGATSSTLVISNVLLANLGDYAVLVGNGFSSNTSDTATLSMSPSITMPFVGGTAVWGYSATLSVGAIGTGLLSYQWFQNGVAIADATNPVFSLSSVQFTNGGPYSVVVSSDLGSVTNTALLVVNPAGTVMGMCASITITGVPGYTYVIQYTSDLAVTNSWITLTNLTLQQPVELWVDTSTNAQVVPHRYYQVLPGL